MLVKYTSHAFILWHASILWRHQNGNIFRGAGPLRGRSTGHRWIPLTWGQWRGVWIFFLICVWTNGWVNTLRPRPNRRHFADDIFKCIFLNENVWISLKISLKFVPKVRINNIPTLVQIMAWRLTGDKPLSESMLLILLTHICVTRPQWVNNRDTGYLRPQRAHYEVTVMINICHIFPAGR